MIRDISGGAMHNVANIWRDLKCGVEYMEWGIIWNVKSEMGYNARCDACGRYGAI